jgi:hypothetical protein
MRSFEVNLTSRGTSVTFRMDLGPQAVAG